MGEVHPILQLAKTLMNRGHVATVVSHETFSADAKAEGVPFKALDTLGQHATFLDDGSDLNAPKTVPRFFKKHCLPKIGSDYEILSGLCNKPNSVLISRYAASVAELLIAERFGTPVVRVFTAVAQQTTMHLLIAMVSTVLAEDINAARARLGFSPMADWRRWIGLPALQLGFWSDWFADDISDRQLRAVGFVYGGPGLSALPPYVPASTLLSQKPILITAGTGKFVPPAFFEVSVRACNIIGRKAVVVCQRHDLVPFASSNAVTVLRWVPSMLNLMKQMSAVVHHGGTITAAEAVATGLPQLVLPVGADRPDTAARLRRLGVADFLPLNLWEENAVAKSLLLLLNSQAVADACSALAVRMDNSATVRACELIEANHSSVPLTL